jgi:hypothetical protein
MVLEPSTQSIRSCYIPLLPRPTLTLTFHIKSTQFDIIRLSESLHHPIHKQGRMHDNPYYLPTATGRYLYPFQHSTSHYTSTSSKKSLRTVDGGLLIEELIPHLATTQKSDFSRQERRVQEFEYKYRNGLSQDWYVETLLSHSTLLSSPLPLSSHSPLVLRLYPIAISVASIK